MVDGWRGDDWFHNGAFRQQNLPYIYEQVATRDNTVKWWSSYQDDYDLYMQAGSAGNLAKIHGMEQLGFWNKVLAHPAYDAFWSDQAVDKVLAARPLTVPVMLVHSLWDQEDIYGAMAVYSALQSQKGSAAVKLVMGPWHHGQSIGEGSSLGPLRFGSDTARYFREQILRPFLAQYLIDGAPGANLPAVTAFETGTNQWRKFDRWPPACEQGCATGTRSLYLQPDSRLGFDAPTAGATWSEYISDPARPVPFRARPIQPVGYSDGLTWPRWLVDDQREASGRTDVLTFTSSELDKPLRVSGSPAVHLLASTSGTDGDFVVKLIDVYPDQVPEQRELGGYQLAVSMDILRGRYREGFSQAKPLKSNQPLEYRFALPNCNHVFLPGHRLMVQIQSSWFPLYDRNPQTFVPNIFLAQPSDYRKATVRVYHSAKQATFIALPVVSP
jgi:putative CocE/NonD family hydrolase